MKDKIKEYFPFVTWGMVGWMIWMVAKADGRLFTTPAKKYKTEDVIEGLDPIKLYGEYIIDSIEEVETQKFRTEQIKKDSFYMKSLKNMDSLLRLNVFLTSRSAKANDTLNRNVEHALEHVDN